MRIIRWLGCCVYVLLGVACRNPEGYVLSGKISVDNTVREYKLTLQGVDTVLLVRPDAENNFRINLPLGCPFFNLEGVIMKNDRMPWQFITPVCLKADGALKLDIVLGDGKATLYTHEKTNGLIQKLRVCYNQKMKELWDTPPSSGSLENWVNSHVAECEKIMSGYDCEASEEEYIHSWNQVEYLKFFKGVRYLFPDSDCYRLPATLVSSLPDVSEVLDKPYWRLFQNSAMEIMFYLQEHEKEPEGQLRLLNERFQTQSIRDEISGQIVANFLKRYPFSLENLARMEKLCAGRSDKKDLVEQFKGKEFSSVGAQALEVAFEDVNGKTHRLSDFRGKYVFVDMWASWCGPCCAEMPALEKLKKELGNPNVVFVCISVDKNKEHWKRKMEQLGLKGNQWIVTDDTFSRKMNIKTIPHFMLYDKNGKLMEYRAPNPSKSVLRFRLERLR